MKTFSTFKEIHELIGSEEDRNISISIDSIKELKMLVEIFSRNKTFMDNENMRWWEEYIEKDVLSNFKDYMYNSERKGYYVNVGGYPILALWFGIGKEDEDQIVKFIPRPYIVELL